jgi:hypothetical protein
MTENINFMWNQHVYDKEYFIFMRQLVNRGELGQMVSRKSRKKDVLMSSVSPGSVPPTAPAEQPSAAAAGVGVESMELGPSEAAAEAAGEQQQTQQMDAQGEAAAPLGPSGSRRLEEQELVAECLTRVGMLFQFQIYHLAHNNLKSDVSIWQEALKSLMVSNQVCLLVALKLFTSHNVWVNTYLSWEAPEETQKYFEHLLVWVLEQASQRCFSPAGGNNLLIQPVLDLVNVVLVPVLQASVEESAQCSVQPVEIARVISEFGRCGDTQMLIVVGHTMSVRLLAQAISNLLDSPDRDDSWRELLSMYRMLDEWTYHFGNLTAMAAEWNNMQGEALQNPFIVDEGPQGPMVNDQTFRALMDRTLLTGLFMNTRVIANQACNQLACRLTFGNLRASHEAITAILNMLACANMMSYKTLYKLAESIERLLELQDGLHDHRVQYFLQGNQPQKVTGFFITTALVVTGNQPRSEEKGLFCVLVLSKLFQTSQTARSLAVQTSQYYGQYMYQLALQLLDVCRDEPDAAAFYEMYARDAQ